MDKEIYCFIFLFSLLQGNYCQFSYLNNELEEVQYDLKVESGETIVTVSVPMPKGANNFAPKIDLVYRSNAHSVNRDVGVAWYLSGLHEIARCPKSFYFDGKASPISYSYTDAFCYDGQRLILTDGLYGYDKSEYRTEIDNQQKVVAYGMHGQGPKMFKVFTRDNLIMTFGDSSDSFLSPMLPNNTNLETISRWYLTSIEDYNYNRIRFSYLKEKNYCYLSSVLYANRAINFAYESRTDVQTKYYSNYLDLQMNKRLKNVSITVNKQELKRLELEYTRYSPTELSLLKYVKLCVTDTCTRPLEFDYDHQSGRFASAQYFHDICGNSDVCELKQVADMNGDGLVDIVAFGRDGVYVSVNNYTSFLTATKWTTDFSRVTSWTPEKYDRFLTDMNKDGLPDIVGFGEDGVYVSYNANGYFHKIEKYFNGYGYNTGWRVGEYLRFLSDVDNDGIPELIGLAFQSLEINLKKYGVYAQSIGWGKYYPFFLEDLNGDGFKDSLGIQDVIYSSLNNALEKADKRQLKNGAHFLYQSGWRIGEHVRTIVDVNDDNLADLVGFANGQAFIALSSVDVQRNNEYTFIPSVSGFQKLSYRTQLAADVNGDGFVDLISFECEGVSVAINYGKSFSRAELWVTDIKSCDSEWRIYKDMNGDNLPDLVAFYGNTVKIGYNLNRQGKLVQLKDSFGNIKRLNYSTLAVENANKNLNATKAGVYSDFGANPDVVASLISSDGSGGINTVNYSYGPYRCGKTQGRTDYTFLWIKSTSTETEISKLDEFYHEYPLTNVLKRKRQFYRNTLLQDARFSYSVKTRNLFINQVLLQQKSTDIFDLNGVFMKTESTESLYDIYGNSYKTTKSVTDNKETYSRVTQYEFKNNEVNWWIGQLSSTNEISIKRTNNNNPVYYHVKEEFYEYNQTSRLLRKKTKQPNDDVALEELYIHDAFCNIIATTQKALKSSSASDTRTSSVVFDSNGLNIIQRKNSLSHLESFKYDLFDNIIENVDMNKLRTVYAYNKFGRKTQIIAPQGVVTTWTYEWDEPQSLENSIYRISGITDGKMKDTTYYDSLNRPIRSVRIGINGESIYEDSIYNSLGQLVKQSMPYKPIIETAKYTVYEYDALSREVNKTDLFKKGETIYTEYFGFKTIKSDHLGRISTSISNVLDQIVSVEDAAGSMAFYDYDVYGNLLKIVDPQGSIITMRYNINGQKMSKIDTFTGITYYTYNAFDELMATKHSSGLEIRFQRDSLGRMTTRDEPEGKTSWVYDTSKTGIGKLHKATGPSNYYSEMRYDNFGRLVQQLYSYDKSSNYTVSTEFDKMGRILVETYPSNVKIYKCYNNYGYLYAASMTDALCKTHLWKLSDSNARGNILREEYGNNVVTDYTYTEVNQVASINSVFHPLDQVLRRLDYKYDRRQNLVSKSDVDSFGKYSQQNYDYDILNRLSSAAGYETINNIQRLTESSAWMYDSVGNHIYAHDPKEIKLYTYDERKPQQATKVGTESLRYDHSGNVVESDIYKIDWFSFSKAKTIISSGQTVTFNYGPERELITKTLNNGNTTVYYLGNTYEKWVIRTAQDIQTIEKYFIRVLDKTVATRIVSQSIKAPTPRISLLYQHNDAFSSVDSITDENGLLVLKYNYTAFGKARVSYSNLGPDLLSVLNAGYSGHNHIEGDRLINMNGRIFDTVFLRFLSPDPFVQDIYNIQNLNRYSYALNNPFKFKDPNGYFFSKLWNFVKKVANGVWKLIKDNIVRIIIEILKPTSTPTTQSVPTSVNRGVNSFEDATVSVVGSSKQSLRTDGFKDFGRSRIFPLLDPLEKADAYKIRGEKIFDGIEVSALSFAAAQLYKATVGYELATESAASKSRIIDPVKSISGIECQGGPLACGESAYALKTGQYSISMNKFGDINTLAGLADVFQFKLPDNKESKLMES